MNGTMSRGLLSMVLMPLMGCADFGRSVLSTPNPGEVSAAPVIAEVSASGGEGAMPEKRSSTIAATSPQTSTSNLIGINVDFPGDYSTTRMFADAIKQSRIWQQVNSDKPARQDANGWPLEDAQITVWHGIGRMHGTYRLSFQGRATVQIKCCAGNLQNQTYNGSTNTTTANLVYPSTDKNGLFLEFRNTQRTPSSPPNSGVTQVKLMRPQTEGGSKPYNPDTLFTLPYKTALKRFQVLRFMDFVATNGNNQVRWGDRLTPSWYSMHQEAPGYGWQGRGGAYELAIQLCNEVGADCWLNVPAKANDQYVLQLAQLVKAQLNPNLKLYIEYSNELWNTSGGFPQSRQNSELAKAEVAAGNSPLNFDRSNNETYWAWRRVAKRGAEMSLIFRQVFGNAAMMTRVRPVLMTQLTHVDGPLLQAIFLMQDYYNNPKRVTQPRPPNYYFYGIGGSAYYKPKALTSVNTAFADFTDRTQWIQLLQKNVDYAAAFGLKRIAYEGGPELEGGNITDQNRFQYRDDPRMKTAMIAAHDTWSAQGGDLLAYFTITTESPWGFVPDLWDATNPRKNLKFQAIDALNARPRAAVTYGVPLPATLEASRYNVPPAWIDDRRPDQLLAGQWFSYTTRVDQAGMFNIKLKASANQANSQVEVWVDGHLIGPLQVPQSTLGETQTLPVGLSKGLHGIMIRGKTGTVKVNQIVVSR